MKIEVTNTQEKNTVDWSIPLQLVENTNWIVLTSGVDTFESRDDLFSGIILESKKGFNSNSAKKGLHFDDFYKSSFKPFKGVITLQND